MSSYDEFWNRMERAAPGLLDAGLGVYTRNRANAEAQSRLRAAQGPLYDANMAGAQTALARAGSMDPRAAAQERLDAQRGLLSGADAKSEADLMRMLHSKGMLGVANYNPGVEGITPSGVAMNPHVAAFHAARNARDAKMAAGSMDAGEAQLDRMLDRSGMLQRNAAAQQQTGLQAQRTQPSRAASNAELLKGIGGVLTNKDIWGRSGGLFGIGVDWLKDSRGGGLGFDVGFGEGWN
jgi:hypothetical protein